MYSCRIWHPALRCVSVQGGQGTYPISAPPVRINGEIPKLNPVPALDEHAAAIRAEFGEDNS
jgi:hypothetical protein